MGFALRNSIQKLSFSQQLCWGLLWAVSLSLALYIGCTQRYRGHYTGDDYSSEAVWIAGKNFADVGFWKLHFVPVQLQILMPQNEGFKTHNPVNKAAIPQVSMAAEQEPSFYTHYPPGSDYVQALLFKLGFTSWQSHQLLALAVSFVGSLFAWLALSLLVTPGAALCAWGVLILSPSFLFFADSLQQFPWFILFRWYLLWRIVKLLKDSSSDIQWIQKLKKVSAEFFVLGFMAAWFSFDAIPALILMPVGLLFSRPRQFVKKQRLIFCIAVAAAPMGEVFGFLVHILKNGLVLGGVKEAVIDLWQAYQLRAGLDGVLARGQEYSLLKHFAKALLGLQWFFTWPLIFLSCVGWWVAYKKEQNPQRVTMGLLISSVLGYFFWQIFMRQHAMVHGFTQRHLDVFVVLGAAFFVNYFLSLRKILLWGVLILFALHIVLAVFAIEGTGVKRYVVSQMIQPQDRDWWACEQKKRLQGSAELQGAKQVVEEILQQDKSACMVSSRPKKWRYFFAELVLFWR